MNLDFYINMHTSVCKCDFCTDFVVSREILYKQQLPSDS